MDSYIDNKINKVLLGITFVLVMLDLWIIVFQAPMVPEQEWAQRIFYYHVPLAWNAFLAYLGVMVFSLLYLLKRTSKWDVYATSAAEIGTIFCLLILITGPIWAKPIWGNAWTWEPRLTTTMILFLLYMGYFMIREFGGPYERSSRYAAVIGIMAFIDVPIIYFAVDFWAPEVQSHPQREIGGHSADISMIFLFSLFCFTLILINLFRYRVHVGKLVQQRLES